MFSHSVPSQRVRVERDTHHFVVFVDREPVLRCTARREALRYAVLVRRAITRTDPTRGRQPPSGIPRSDPPFLDPANSRRKPLPSTGQSLSYPPLFPRY